MRNVNIKDILFTEEEIQKKVDLIGEQIKRDFGDEDVVLIGILRGAFIFTADLAKRLGNNVMIDFMEASSYGNSTVSSGNVRILKDIETDVNGKHVILIEDIIDTGNTLEFLRKLFEKRDVKSVSIAAFLSKPARRKKDVKIDYMGYEIPDKFVIGYGMDYAEKFRNLPYIATAEFIDE